MELRSYFLVVRMVAEEGKSLVWGQDIFARPMPWGVWFKAIWPAPNSPYRFLRVIGLREPETDYHPYMEAGDVYFDTAVFMPEKVTGLAVIEWVIESVYYLTSIKFWNWPMFASVKRFLKAW